MASGFNGSLLHQNEKFQEILDRIDCLLNSNRLVIIAIDGKCGSGKTTLANELGRLYDSNVFHMDDYYLRPELKTEERLKEVGGNVDYERFKDEVIKGILSGKEFNYQIYDCKKMQLTDIVSVSPRKLNIIEGSYSMHPSLIDNYHLKIFLDIDEESQKERILNRNGIEAYSRFVNEWIPKENQYFEKMNIREKCDLVISWK